MKNKIKFIMQATFLLFHLAAIAQNKKATFEMKIYFEDAKGNKDSVTVGYDKTASYDEVDKFLGEDEILAPFDSIFDVRVIKSSASWDSPITGKKRIRKVETELEPLFKLSIIINAKYPPVKIIHKENLTASGYPYMPRTILAKTYHVFLKESGWYDANDWLCFTGQNEISLDMKTVAADKPWYTRNYMVKGKTELQPIKALLFVQFGSGPTCSQILPIEENIQLKTLSVYPNPAGDFLQFTIGEEYAGYDIDYYITDINGKTLQKHKIGNIKNKRVEISELSQGMYFLQILNSGRVLGTTKFVKLE